MIYPTIEPAKPEDAEPIRVLQWAYYSEQPTLNQNGFLSKRYDGKFFEKCISNKDILVFRHIDGLAGFVLVNTVEQTDHIRSLQGIQAKHVPTDQANQTGYSYQILITERWQNTGFYKIVQDKYAAYFGLKFRQLVSTINKLNTRSLNAHINNGWDVLTELNNAYVVRLDLANYRAKNGR